MIFYDFEVFRYDWLVVLIDLNARKETVIINDPDKLKRFYEEHKGVIWAGYNSRNYDQYILKAILCGFDTKPVNAVSYTHLHSSYIVVVCECRQDAYRF